MVGVKNILTDSVYLYVDGLLVNQSYILSGNNDSYQGFVIGGHHLNRYMDIEIDELRIWNKALSIQEIQEHMNCPPTENESALVGYWNFEQGEGETVIDLSGNGNDGTSTVIGSSPCDSRYLLIASMCSWSFSATIFQM